MTIRKGKYKRWQRIAFSWVTIAILLLVGLLLLRSSIHLYLKNREVNSKLATARAELLRIEERKRDLQERLAHVGSSAGMEYELRQKFDVSRAGERVLVIVDTPEHTKQGAPADVSWWSALRTWLGL